MALLFGTGIAHAQTVAKTCIDYDPSSSTCKGGTITAARVPGESCQWTITAVPSSIGSFRKWNYDSDLVRIVSGTTTSKTITIEFVDPNLTDTIPCTAVFGYSVMHCDACGDFDVLMDTTATSTVTYPHETDNMAQSTKSDWRGTIRATHLGESCWELYAVPKTGSAFAQWSDGWAYNPRTIDIIDKDTVTYYATFISSATKGTIDAWARDGLTITTTDVEGTIADEGYVTVFYDGVPMSSELPSEYDYGVYTVNATYSDELAGKKCHIVYKDAGCEPYATLDAIIPVLVDGSTVVTAPTTDDGKPVGVHVLQNGVATLGTQTIGDLDIYPGGKAIIEGAVTVESVTMRADGMACAGDNTTDFYPNLLVLGSLTNKNSNIVNVDYTIDYWQYYPFSLPYGVHTSDVTYRSGADAASHFAIKAYDGAARASTGAGWVTYYDYVGDPGWGIDPTGHVTIEAGRGYDIFAEPYIWNSEEQFEAVIRFPMTVNLTSGEATRSALSVEPNDDGGAADPGESHWNLIGAPYLSSYREAIQMYDGSTYLDDVGYVYYSIDGFQSYLHEMADAVELVPFHSYYIQVDPSTTHISFVSPTSGRVYAPARRAAKANVQQKLAAGLTLTQGDKSDHTGLLIGENYTADYDFNADLSKMFGRKQGLAVFSLAGTRKQAYMALPFAEGLSTQETVIPLGYSKAKAGQEMTFAFDEARYPSVRDDERIQSLNLIDYAEGSMTDLLQDSYTCTATEAANNERFALAIRYIKNGSNVATGICDDAKPTKMRDGVYDLMGRRVNIDDARTLGAGVYVIIENGKARKEVIR